MGRFDVFRLNAKVPLVVEVQADLLSDLASTVVIPLLPEAKASKTPVANLNPSIRVAGVEYRLLTDYIATLPRIRLGTYVVSINDQSSVIMNAVDFLLQGF